MTAQHLVDDVHEDYVVRLIGSMTLPHVVKRCANCTGGSFIRAVGAAVRSALGTVLSALGWDMEARMLRGMGETSVHRLWQLTNARKQLRHAVAQAMQTQGLEALVCPAHCLPATPHGAYKDITVTAWPTYVFNLLDWPAGVLPVTTVLASDDA